MDAVRSDDVSGSHGFAGGEPDVDMPFSPDDIDAACAKMDRVRLQPPHRVYQHAVKVAAVKQDVRRAIPLVAGRAKIVPVPGVAGAPVADFLAQRTDGDATERFFEAERQQNTAAIRADLDAGADLAELRGLLVHIHIHAVPEQSKGGDESANATPDHDDLIQCCHSVLRINPP